MIRVFLVDDHTIFREGIKKLIATDPELEVAGESGDGREALDLIVANDYDVVLLDLGLPGMDGLTVLRSVKQRKPSLPVIILSIYSEDQYAVRVLKEGASGYLTKESVPSDLIRAIFMAARGRKYVSHFLGERLANNLVGKSGEQPHELLSGREFQVFCMIAAGKPISKIARELCLAPTTVSSHRTRILNKMGMKTNMEIIRYAIENKLIT